MDGWIKLHRRLLEWEWFGDANTLKVFIYLLIKANHQTATWRGITVEPGQVITGRKELSKELRLGEQVIRTCLNRLKSTNEITIKSTTKYSIISLSKWDCYQKDNQQKRRTITNDQPTTNQQLTTNKNDNNNKNEKKSFFDDFWGAWKPYDMPKGSRQQAVKSYEKALQEIDHDHLTQAAKRYCEQCNAGSIKTKHASTWLNQRGWEDDTTHYPPKPGRSSGYSPLTALELANADTTRQAISTEALIARLAPPDTGRRDLLDSPTLTALPKPSNRA